MTICILMCRSTEAICFPILQNFIPCNQQLCPGLRRPSENCSSRIIVRCMNLYEKITGFIWDIQDRSWYEVKRINRLIKVEETVNQAINGHVHTMTLVEDRTR